MAINSNSVMLYRFQRGKVTIKQSYRKGVKVMTSRQDYGLMVSEAIVLRG